MDGQSGRGSSSCLMAPCTLLLNRAVSSKAHALQRRALLVATWP